MKNITKRSSGGARFIRSYEKMRGINLAKGNERDSFCYLENMYVDYESGDVAVESIPGFRRILSFGDAIHLICSVGEYVLIHAGESLYKIKREERDNNPALCPIASLSDNQSYAYSHNGLIFITDGEKIISVNSSGGVTEHSAPTEALKFDVFATYEGDLLITSTKSKPCKVFRAVINDDDSSISTEYCFTAPENTLSMLSAYGYLWIFTTNSVLGYMRADGAFREEIRFNGIMPTGEACLFYNDLIFLTKTGVFSVFEGDKIRLVPRSVAINPMLLNEDLSCAKLAIWRGYLVVSIDGRMYLADSRDKITVGEHDEYRWYYLNGIGTHRGDTRVYRYAEFAPEGFSVYQHPYEIVDGEIMSVQNGNGEKVYFVNSENEKYSVYPTEQMRGGIFFPATCLCQCDELLFFGTECGDLCLFNNDMRGKAPRRLSEDSGFNADEYEALARGKIHPDFYSFDFHAPRYALLTPSDCCGLPFDKKSDLPPALAIRLKGFAKSSLLVETRYDGGEFLACGRISSSIFNFYDLDFGAHSSSSEEYCTEIIPKRRVGWKEKQISIYSDEFCSPFGVFEICFAYKTLTSKKHSKKGT